MFCVDEVMLAGRIFCSPSTNSTWQAEDPQLRSQVVLTKPNASLVRQA